MKALTKAQAHMFTCARLLGHINHLSGFRGGIRTALALANRRMLTLSYGEGGAWSAFIPAEFLMNEAGMRWVNDTRQFIQMGPSWTGWDNTVPGLVARHYAARTWHDGRRYFLVNHPLTEESTVVFEEDLNIKEHDSE